MNMKRLLWGFLMIAAVALVGCSSDGDGGRIADLEQQLSDEMKKATDLQRDLTEANQDLNEVRMALGLGSDATLTDIEEEIRDLGTDSTDSTDSDTLAAVRTALGEEAANATQDQLVDMIRALQEGPGGDITAMDKAITAGIVNADAMGDPQGTDAPNRPGNKADMTEDFEIVKDSGSVGTIGDDQLDKQDDKKVTDPDDSTKMINDPNQFMMTGSAPMLMGFDGQGTGVYAKSSMKGKQTDTVTVFTDMADPMDKAYTYTEYYNVKNRPGVTNIQEMGVLTLNYTDLAVFVPLFNLDGLPTDPGDAKRYSADNIATTETNEGEHAGSFNGIDGTYTCDTAGGCLVEAGEDGISVITGDWTFKPTETMLEDITVTIEDEIKDNDYLSFGYWVRATEDDDGMMTYGIGTFYDGAQDFTATIGSLEGNATYTGKAAGQYGKKTAFDPTTGKVAAMETGAFSADVKLMANFGGDDIAPNNRHMISGSVNNFMDGSEDLGWTLALEGSRGNIMSDNTFLGTTKGGGDAGNWMGSFFGNPVDANGNAVMNDPTTIPAEDAPTGVAGEFTGHFDNGHVIGAFGANVDKMQ